MRKRSSSNSVAVSAISSPARWTSRLSSSSVRSPTTSWERRALVDRAGAAHERPQPGHDLLEAERLGDVVVAAGRQPGHPVLDGVAGGEEQDRDVLAVGAQLRQHGEPVEVGQHDVEDDGVGPEVARDLDARPCPCGPSRTSQPS